MAWQDDSEGNGGCCTGRPRHHRIRPLSAANATSHTVEVRLKRVIRIQHINARLRDARFQMEMQMQQSYKTRGLQAGVVYGGPLTMPTRKSAPSGPVSFTSTPLPNCVLGSIGGDSDSVNPNRLSSATRKVSLTTPSNIQLAMKDGVHTETGTPIPKNQRGSRNTESAHAKQSDSRQAFISVPDSNISSTISSTPHTPDISPHHRIQSGSNHPTSLLFFIHGVGGSSDIWQNQMKCFAQEGYEIVAPDLIGHGLSCAPRQAQAYHFREICADMEEIFDKYCKKKNVIIGHSYGCSFAVMLARRRSRRVHKLVLISGGGPTPLAPQPGIFKLPICMLGCFRPCLNCGFKKSAFHRLHDVGAEEAFAIPTYVLQHTMNGQDWPDGDEIFHQWLFCPTLLIYGAQDKLVSLQEEKHMAEVIFRSQLEVINDASHMVMIETPDEVNNLIRNFILEDSGVGGDNPPSPVPEDRPDSQASNKRSASRVSNKSTKSHKALPNHSLQNSLWG